MNTMKFFKVKTHLFLLIFLLVTTLVKSQTYYVTGSALNLRLEPTTSAEVIKKLAYCDNLTISEEQLTEGWTKVTFENVQGYVSSEYIKKGKCEAYTYSYRVGAKCRDGTSSSATGRGACSHHGGVEYWKTKSETKYTIVNN